MKIGSHCRPAWHWMIPFGVAVLLAAAPATSTASRAPAVTAPARPDARTAGRHPSVSPAQSSTTSTGARLELVDQRLAVDPNGDVQLRYVLTGLTGDDPLQLQPRPEPPAPPTTETSIPPGSEPVAPPEPAPPLTSRLTLEITNYSPLTDPDDVDRVVGSDVDPNVFRTVGDAIDGVVIDARPLLTANDDGTVDLVLDIETDVVDSIETRLKLDRPGIYPLRVQLFLEADDAEDVIATAGTVIQRVAGAIDTGVDTPPPIDLAVVTVTTGPPPDADEATLDIARARLDDAIELAAAIDAPVTLEVPPTLIAEEAETPEDAERLAVSLADDELVALPIVPLDVSSAVAAGQAEAYTRLLGAGEDLLTDSLPTTSSRRDIWITTDPLSAGGAQHLRDLGTRFVVIPAELYEAVDRRGPPAERPFRRGRAPRRRHAAVHRRRPSRHRTHPRGRGADPGAVDGGRVGGRHPRRVAGRTSR